MGWIELTHALEKLSEGDFDKVCLHLPIEAGELPSSYKTGRERAVALARRMEQDPRGEALLEAAIRAVAPRALPPPETPLQALFREMFRAPLLRFLEARYSLPGQCRRLARAAGLPEPESARTPEILVASIGDAATALRLVEAMREDCEDDPGFAHFRLELKVGLSVAAGSPGEATRVGLAALADLPDPKAARASTAALLRQAGDPVSLLALVDALMAERPDDDALTAIRADLAARVDTAPLRAWLEWTRETHGRLLLFHRLMPHRAIEEVWVEVRVAGTATAEGLDPCRELPRQPKARDEGRRLLDEVLAAAARGEGGRCWTLVGNPGSGKTTLLRRVATREAEVALRALEAGQAPTVPIYVSLGAWATSGLGLVEHAQHEASAAGLPAALGAHLSTALREGRGLLLLDGLDEVSPDRVHPIAAEVARLAASTWPACRIVLASRPQGYLHPSPLFGELELLPLGPDEQALLVHAWLSDPPEGVVTDPDALLSRIQRDPHLGELAEVPLLLTMMCLVERQGAPVASRRSEVYKQVLDLLLRGKPRGQVRVELKNLPVAERALRRLALSLLEADQERWDGFAAAKLLEVDPALGPLIRLSWGSTAAMLEDIESVSQVVFAADADRETWRFVHRSVQEFLAASAMTEVPGSWRELVGRVDEGAGRWGEVFSLLAGLVPPAEARELLVELARQKPALGLRALATCDGLRDEEVAEVVGIGRPDMSWTGYAPERFRELEERRRWFAELGGKVDGPRATRLVERLLPKAPVVDLAFAWMALGRIDGPEARALRQREAFFAAAGRPLVEVPGLRWVRVPSGRFRMGSPETEEGRFQHEGPAHEVEIPYALEAMHTPVTNAMYEVFDSDHRALRAFPDGPEADLHPVSNVCWYEAAVFALWLGWTCPDLVDS